MTQDKAKIWINIAEEDLKAAEWNYEGKHYLWVVFMCQQTLEKALKAIYLNKTADLQPPFKHDLISLAKHAEIFDECSEKLIDLFGYLSTYYIETRYNEKRDELKAKCTQDITSKVLQDTKEAYEWLKSKLM